MILQPGDVILVGGGDSFLSRLIYWGSSTRTEKCIFSHTMLAAGQKIDPVSQLNVPLTFGADALVKLGIWDPTSYRDVEVYTWTSPRAHTTAAMHVDALVKQLDGKYYGLQQYLFFGWRKLCNTLRFPPRWAIHQWFNGDYICTTVVNMQIRFVCKNAGISSPSCPYGNGALTPLDIRNLCKKLVDTGDMKLSFSKHNSANPEKETILNATPITQRS